MGQAHQIGAYIKRKRIERKMSQEALANLIGVSRVAVTKWESGDTQNLKQTHLTALSTLFNVSLEELLTGTAGWTKNPPANDFPAQTPRANAPLFVDSPGAMLIEDTVALMKGMDENKKRMVATFARILSETEV